VVDLVQDHEGLAGHRPPPVHRGRHAHLRIRQDGAVEVARGVHVGVAERMVELDADPGRGGRPLCLQMLGRADHGDRFDRAVGEQLGGDPQSEGGLAGARGGDRHEVVGPAPQVLHKSLALPGPQRRKGLQIR
jgi:hypothetical protein